MNAQRPGTQPFTLIAALSICGGCVGLATGWWVGRLVKSSHLKQLLWSDVLALTLAAALLVIGLVTGLLATTRKGQAILANPRAPDYGRPVRTAQVIYFRLQGAVLLLAGAMLAAPVMVTQSETQSSSQLRLVTLWLLVLSFAAQTALNISIWRRSDEVFRRVISESGAVTFWLFQGVLFIWAAAEKLLILPAISSWEVVSVMMAVYLVASTAVSYRRGLG